MSQSINKVVADDVVGPADPASLKGKTISIVGAFTVSSGRTDVLVTPVVLEAKYGFVRLKRR